MLEFVLGFHQGLSSYSNPTGCGLFVDFEFLHSPAPRIYEEFNRLFFISSAVQLQMGILARAGLQVGRSRAERLTMI